MVGKNTFFIRDIPKQERPREKLLETGSKHLTNQELLSVLLGSGTKHESVMTLAQRVLVTFGGIESLKDTTYEELSAIKGIGKAKAATLVAAIEFGKRIHTIKLEEKYVVRQPVDVAGYIMDELRHLKQEHFIALYLDTKNQIIHQQTLFIGSLNASIVHPREIFKEAVKRSAASIICAHNHPSGDPTPSQEDIQITKRISECGKMIGIEVLDHIVIGNGRYVSLKEKGYL
ncbi:DNA repair protein RadC [Salirhabdus salicampi]|nr:DNA repair protein RadC [Salirhabdus salicampi]MCP8617014.1 DNA repair protein RadC [Salirhabdus salicampi]